MIDYMWNPGPTDKVILNKTSIHISGSQLNIIASILDLFKIFFEVVVGAKVCPYHKNWTY